MTPLRGAVAFTLLLAAACAPQMVLRDGVPVPYEQAAVGVKEAPAKARLEVAVVACLSTHPSKRFTRA